MINSKALLSACGAIILLLTPVVGAAVPKVITWGGNSPAWNRVLHLAALRLGCSDPPSGCADYAQQLSRSQGVDKVFLAILLRADRTPDEAREYSRLSLSHPALFEVGFDDFVGQCERQSKEPAAVSPLLIEIASSLKSANPNLHLGITIYEDELGSSSFPLRRLDSQFRKSVDFVHLYPHYRKESQSYATSVQLAKELFPAAQIIAGIYAYDRRDYLPCAQGSSTPCTDQDEVSLFSQSLKERVAVVNEQGANWIEFYPGGFGNEEKLNIWKEPRGCHPERQHECVQNTKAMREVVRQVLSQ